MHIKNCPFCGSKARLLERGKCFTLRYILGCTEAGCWAWIPEDARKREFNNYSGGVWRSKEDLIKAWNLRR
jgi:hypothetical protein